jgi:hypothetical protein
MFYDKIKITEIVNTGSAYPSQWDLKGVDKDGYVYNIYARYRSHRFYVMINDSNNPDWNDIMKVQDCYRFLIHTFLPDMKEESYMTERELKKYSKHILIW